MRLDVPALAAALDAPAGDAAPAWLADATAALHPGGGLLAVAHGPRVALAPLSSSSSAAAPSVAATTAAGDAVTALAFVAFASSHATGGRGRGSGGGGRDGDSTHAALPPLPRPRDGLLLVGTARGVVQVHGCRGGAPLLTQKVHAGPVVSFHARAAGAGTDPSAPDDDVSVASPDAVARLAGAELAALASVAARRGGAASIAAAAAALPPLAVARWDLSARAGPRSDALVAGPRPPSLRGALDGDAAPRVLIASAGGGPNAAASNMARDGRHAARRA